MQAQMADIQARTAIDEQKIQLAAMKQQQLDERESARIAGDLAIREFQAEHKFQDDVDLELIKASLKEGL
jgi:HSP20 family molecular chaperone IbpA